MRNDTTPRGYPLPHIDNPLEIDVNRLRAALMQIDTDMTEADNPELAEEVGALGERVANLETTIEDGVGGSSGEFGFNSFKIGDTIIRTNVPTGFNAFKIGDVVVRAA
ncbi:hypothetical protein FACS1894216_02730 [Synergistales bacterium]|nr:hypothetical protein FACS1894216_02730 [Synergistales bacterium]